MKNTWEQRLLDLGACDEARAWASAYATLSEAWQECHRADWFIWYARRVMPEDAYLQAEEMLYRPAARQALDAYETAELRAKAAWRAEQLTDDAYCAAMHAALVAYRAACAHAARLAFAEALRY